MSIYGDPITAQDFRDSLQKLRNKGIPGTPEYVAYTEGYESYRRHMHALMEAEPAGTCTP